MAINLLDMVQSQLGGAAMSQIGKFLGEDESKAAAGMSAALPAILGSVMQKGSSESGAAGILDMLGKGGHDGSMFDNLGALLGGGNATNGLMNTGGTLLQFFMGDKTQAVTDLIIRSTGLGKGTTGSILRMAAPMLIGMIGKQVTKSGMNASGLMDLLGGQKGFLKGALPAGMGSLLGFSDMGDEVKEAVGNVAGRATVEASDASDSGKSMMSRLLPLALIAVLAFFGYRYFTGGKNIVSDATSAVGTAVDKTADMAGDAANAVGDAAGDAASVVATTAENAADVAGNAAGAVADAAGEAFDAATKAARAALSNIKFAAGSAGEGLAEMLGAGGDNIGKSVTFKNLNFKTGSSEIDPSTLIEVENLAKVLNAYPNIKFEIGGHTDNTGNADANLQLSKERATVVAKTLVRQGGIDRNRLSIFGYGDGKPIGDNKTEAGRAANRRIEITIVE